MSRKWDREEMLEAARRWAREHGRSPNYKEWKPATDDYPGANTVAARFGSWLAFLDEAGVPVSEKQRLSSFPGSNVRNPAGTSEGEPPLPFEPPVLTEAQRKLAARLRSN